MDVSVTLSYHAISSATTSQTINTSTPTDVTNLSISNVRGGYRNPYRITLVPSEYDGTNPSGIEVATPALSTTNVFVELVRSGTIIGVIRLSIAAGSVSGISYQLPPSAVEFFDHPPDGFYDYKIRARNLTNAVGEQIIFKYVRLLITEA